MDRTIFHSDMNSFYASVEQAEHPELRGRPIAVAGKQELRHGIILTKSREAKAYGVKTAEAIWEARRKCPDLVVLPPDYKLYQRYSSLARMIYYQYTDLVEPFGLDEAWLDVTDSIAPHDITNVGDAKALLWLLSESVSQRLREDGMRAGTVSIGVSSDTDLSSFSRQVGLRHPTAATRTIARAAWGLLPNPDEDTPIRTLHVRANNLVSAADDIQLSLFEREDGRLEDLDATIDGLRRRYGNTVVQRGIELSDDALAGIDIKGENTVHPVGFLHV